MSGMFFGTQCISHPHCKRGSYDRGKECPDTDLCAMTELTLRGSLVASLSEITTNSLCRRPSSRLETIDVSKPAFVGLGLLRDHSLHVGLPGSGRPYCNVKN